MMYYLALTILVPAVLSQHYNCHGDVTKLDPKGMAPKYGGIEASRRSIDQDIAEINKRLTFYQKAAELNCIHPAVIAGIASRESDAGRLLYRTDGWGDFRNGTYHAYGIMQCDVYVDPLHYVGLNCTTYHWDSFDHINVQTKYELVPYIEAVRRKFPSWTDEQTLQGGVAAYNFGVGNVRSWDHLDVGTTHNDYSNDVIARAQWLIKKYKW